MSASGERLLAVGEIGSSPALRAEWRDQKLLVPALAGFNASSGGVLSCTAAGVLASEPSSEGCSSDGSSKAGGLKRRPREWWLSAQILEVVDRFGLTNIGWGSGHGY
jgi:hypothetical protein